MMEEAPGGAHSAAWTGLAGSRISQTRRWPPATSSVVKRYLWSSVGQQLWVKASGYKTSAIAAGAERLVMSTMENPPERKAM